MANQNSDRLLFPYMRGIIKRLKQMGRIRTSETYLATLKSFMTYRNGNDIPLTQISSEIMSHYEAYLLNRGLTRNTSSFYLRILRAVYNRAVEERLTRQRYPFKHVYTGTDKTVKRAISLDAIRRIKEIDLSKHPSLAFARDIFMLSFYTRGMSFVDMAYLKKKDLSNGILSYRRRKTGQMLHIRWEKCMQEIVEKYSTTHTEYLLPIVKNPNCDNRHQYLNAMCLINRNLKILGDMAKIEIPLTTYVSRHSWASIAKSRNIPVSVISEGMGHDSEATTLIYLASLDMSVVDNANRMILSLL